MDMNKLKTQIGGIALVAIVLAICVYIIHGLIWVLCMMLLYMMLYPLHVLIGGVVGMCAVWCVMKIYDGYFRNK